MVGAAPPGCPADPAPAPGPGKAPGVCSVLPWTLSGAFLDGMAADRVTARAG
jgi:hypothetical protein